MRLALGVSALVIGAAVACGVAFGHLAQADDMTTFSITSPAKEPITIDLGEPGRSVGDLRLINIPFTGDEGIAGTLNGMLVTVDVPDGEDTQLDTMGQLIFDFGGTDSIIVAAESKMVPEGDVLMLDGQQVRAVLGGTGKFVGARGQMLTGQNPDGTWEATFQLMD